MIRPQLRRGALATLLVLASFISYHAALGESDEELPPPDKTAGVNLRDPVVIAKGLEVLSGTCGGYCHGSEGRGSKGPSLRNRTDLTPQMLHTTIYFGRKRAGHLMPAWGDTLSEEKIWTVIAGIVSLRHADSDDPPQTQTQSH
jgi:mono/diheme cytochrome c family protein